MYVHKPWVWLAPAGIAMAILFVLGAIAAWDRPGSFPSLLFLPIYFSIMSFHVYKLRCTVLTNRVLWDSASGNAPVSQITELRSKGKGRWLVKWSSRLERQATFSMSPEMAEELQRRIDHAIPQDETLASPGFVPISWAPIFENLELMPIRNQPPTNFTIPLSLVVMSAVGLALYFQLTVLLLVLPIALAAFAYLLPRVGRILADGYLIEVGDKGIMRAIPVVGATMQRKKSGLWELQGQEETFTLIHNGPIANKLLGRFTPTKTNAAQGQQGRCLLCGESIEHIAEGTVAICQLCQSRVRHEAELTGHGVR